MAKKRMISPEIIDSDLFLEMPQSTRLLYYDLNIRADDDGFVGNPKKIMNAIGCNEDDIKVLISKRYILPFDSGVIVIRHWKLHNYIRKDRYTPSIYTNERQQLRIEENGAYTLCHISGIPDDIPVVYQKNEELSRKNDLEGNKDGTFNICHTSGIPNDIPVVDVEESRIEQYRIEKNRTAVEEMDNIDSILSERNGNGNESLVEDERNGNGNESLVEDERNGNGEENLFEFIEKSFGRTLTSSEYEVISTWPNTELTKYAIKQAELARAFSIRYIERILLEYNRNNIKTVSEAAERDKKFKERKILKSGGFKTKEEKWNEHCLELAKLNGETL